MTRVAIRTLEETLNGRGFRTTRERAEPLAGSHVMSSELDFLRSIGRFGVSKEASRRYKREKPKEM